MQWCMSVFSNLPVYCASRVSEASAALCCPEPAAHAHSQQEVWAQLRPQLCHALLRLPGEHRVPVLFRLDCAGPPLPRSRQRQTRLDAGGADPTGTYIRICVCMEMLVGTWPSASMLGSEWKFLTLLGKVASHRQRFCWFSFKFNYPQNILFYDYLNMQYFKIKIRPKLSRSRILNKKIVLFELQALFFINTWM